ncbi:alpha/beta hydrolase [Vibrio hippocampi]|uniref:Alpha/beta hydrolase n=1 Tax=Vibrio hippocampi TaxID=654686 RepID=A0ABN8DJ76_9VIBR|nr:alpha/beta hydrolase [Vibrio hippocampi]CAH0528866.1 hypothetical protein VHP8226_02894 [Vibrio hippocampi]
MLFITNRTPKQSARSKKNRKLSFNYDTTAVSQYLYFCERNDKNDYTEIMNVEFFQRLKTLPEKTQLLFYIHGFNNNMEPDIFENAKKLQSLINEKSQDLVYVVPIIWPCDDDSAIAFIDDYWDDQDAADASGPAFARLLGKFDTWRRDTKQQEVPCLKRINILAHSMGNRVLNNALNDWAKKYCSGNMPQLFRNVFMIAADVENEILEKNQSGRYIVDSCRNLVVYYANDDLAMPASKLVNLKNKTVSRRMGMTGPEQLSILPKKVYEVDCDDFNNDYDLKGHTYFLSDKDGNVSPIIEHMTGAIKSGRVSPKERSYVLKK